MKRPLYKKVILYVTEIDQLISYLEIAVDNLAPHAKHDGYRFVKMVKKQLKNQKLQHKGKL